MVKIIGFRERKSNSLSSKRKLSSMFFSLGFGTLKSFSDKDSGVALGLLQLESHKDEGFYSEKKIHVLVSGDIVYDRTSKRYSNPAQYIFERYVSEGLDFAKDLNGSFNIIIIDNGALHIINDRTGMRPIYYYHKDGVVLFASEIKALLAYGNIKKDIDWDFWKDFFSYGYSLGDKTPFKHIKILPESTILSMPRNSKNIHISKYWDYENIIVNTGRNAKKTVEEGTVVIKKIFERYGAVVKDCSVMLSGGYDSRCIVSALKKYSDINITTYTSSKKIGVYVPNDDARIGSQVAKKLGLKNHMIIDWKDFYRRFFVKHIIESDGLCVENGWMLPAIEHLNPTIPNFDGIAGDVFLKAGYLVKPEWNKDKDIFQMNRLDDEALSRVLHEKLLRLSVARYKDSWRFFDYDISPLLLPDHKNVLSELKQIKDKENKIKIFQVRNRTRNAIALAPNNLVTRKTFSYCPFLDNEFVEFGLSIPLSMKVRDDIYRKILERLFPDVMKIETTNDPKSLKEYLKNGLVRMKLDSVRYVVGSAKNLKKHNKEEHQGIKVKSFSENPLDLGYLLGLTHTLTYPKFFNQKEFLEQIQAYTSKDIDPSDLIIPILQFLVWYNVFVLGRKVE